MKTFKDFIIEKKLTPAELNKREEVAGALEKDDPSIPMDKKMAIATSVAKRVAESVLDESSRVEIDKKEYDSIAAKHTAAAKNNRTGKYANADYFYNDKEKNNGLNRGTVKQTYSHDVHGIPTIEDGGDKYYKFVKESTELAEISKSTLGSYINKASKSATGLATNAMHHMNTANAWAQLTGPDGRSKQSKDAKKKSDEFGRYSYQSTQKQVKRLNGIEKATSRLVREDEQIDEVVSPFDWKKYTAQSSKSDSNSGVHKGTYGSDTHKAKGSGEPEEKKGRGRPKGDYGSYKIDKATRDDPEYKQQLSAKVRAAKAEGFKARDEFKHAMHQEIMKKQLAAAGLDPKDHEALISKKNPIKLK